VICIGNLTAGGAGKTPTAIALAERLKASGEAPHMLTRGYGGRLSGPERVDLGWHKAEDVGDEALLLARIAPTWVSRDRVVGAKVAAAAGAGVIVLDDGFQNPHLAHDLDLLVVDGAAGFGNGRIMPAGPLRERPADGFSRADAVVVIGSVGEEADGVLGDALGHGLPRIKAELRPPAVSARLRGKRLLAFAGIGRPEKFFKTLQDLGALVVETRVFPDHHPYKPSEIEAILELAGHVDAACITTEKDHVRIPLTLGNFVKKLPIELHFEAADALDRLLSEALQARRQV
jgi:tetraacyldisaccharide 4'-kinase